MEVPIDRFLLPKDLQTMLEERVKTFNNMAQSQMKLTAWDSALASIRQVNIASCSQVYNSAVFIGAENRA